MNVKELKEHFQKQINRLSEFPDEMPVVTPPSMGSSISFSPEKYHFEKRNFFKYNNAFMQYEYCCGIQLKDKIDVLIA